MSSILIFMFTCNIFFAFIHRMNIVGGSLGSESFVASVIVVHVTNKELEQVDNCSYIQDTNTNIILMKA